MPDTDDGEDERNEEDAETELLCSARSPIAVRTRSRVKGVLYSSMTSSSHHRRSSRQVVDELPREPVPVDEDFDCALDDAEARLVDCKRRANQAEWVGEFVFWNVSQ